MSAVQSTAKALDGIDYLSFYELHGKLHVRTTELSELPAREVKAIAEQLNAAIRPIKKEWFEKIRTRGFTALELAKLSDR